MRIPDQGKQSQELHRRANKSCPSFSLDYCSRAKVDASYHLLGEE